MNKAVGLAAAALALLLASGAARPPSPESQLLAADRAFSRLLAEKGRPYASLAFIANDGRLYGNGGEAPIYGKGQAFRRLARREPGTPGREPETARVSADGRMGWTTGRWLLAPRRSRTKSTGHYLTVWVKDRNGAWKIQADMGTSDPAPKR